MRRGLFVAYGNGMTAGPLRGVYSSDAPFGVTDVQGGTDLDGDGRAELLVALNGNQPIVGIARVRDCDLFTLATADGSVFAAATEVNGQNCCPDQFASFRRVQSPAGVDIITTQSFPTNSDGTYVRPEDLIARGSPDAADLDYRWSRTHWKVDSDIVRVVATETGAGRGRDIATDLLSAGLDCLGVTSVVR